MEIIGIILTGVLMSAFLLGSFLLGYVVGSKKESKDGVTVTDNNKHFIEEMQRWKNFDGRR